MGADIHLYVEHSSFNERGGNPYWRGFGGRMNPGRDYLMFEVLAGVRGELSNAMIPPRGLPTDGMAWSTVDDAYLRVDDKHQDEEGYCSRARADKYLEYGAKWRDDRQEQIEHPDWHSHSWMTPAEWDAAIERRMKDGKPAPDPEYFAVSAAMREMEKRGKRVRVVFWFDN